MRLIVLSLCVCLFPFAAFSQDRRPSHCIAVAQNKQPVAQLMNASFQRDVEKDAVRLSYVNHAMFLLQTHGGLSAVTDYVGYVGSADFVPDIVTMNHAHSSHWTASPDPRIKHVLKGWGVGEPADHHLDLGEMLIRNVTTDIRSPYSSGVETDGNSIFIFEVAGLCIGHLGHLHHEPTPAQYAAIGRLDVVLAPVDGGMTLPLPVMIRVLERLRASYVIPMHWFSSYSLQTFVQGIEDSFDVKVQSGSEVTVSLRDLPSRPTVLVLRPLFLQGDDDE